MPISSKISSESPALRRIRALSYVLDNSIPIPLTSRRIGIDPLLGLFPGGGDVAGALISAYIVLEAARFGLPRETLLRMVSNIVTETVVGSIPIVGDFFDATWKANSRNVALVETHIENQHPRRTVDRKFIALLILVLLFIVCGVGFVATLMVRLIMKVISGQ